MVVNRKYLHFDVLTLVLTSFDSILNFSAGRLGTVRRTEGQRQPEFH